jgi:serine/threonine-protein kinase HipA
MMFGSGYALNPANSPWARLATELRLPEAEIRDRAERLVVTAPDAFATAATDPAIRALEVNLPDRLIDLVTQRTKRCARYL